MTTDPGRTTVSYLVRCALPAGHSITKVVAGTSYTFAGQLGMAPEWENGACGTDCQQYVSACMLAHINTSGRHIALWLDSDNPAVGWGRSTDYPFQEGSFFGNIFASPPGAFYCNGKDFDQGLVPGRLGVGTSVGAIYTNPYASGTSYCKDYCAAAPGPYVGDGYTSCNGMHVVTVWRNFDPTVDYKVCDRADKRCMNVVGASQNNAPISESTFDPSKPSMRWRISQVSPGQYSFINVSSGKALDMKNASNSTTLMQVAYKASSTQMWSFTPTGDGYYKFSSANNPNASVAVPKRSSEGAIVEQWAWDGGANMQWIVAPVN
jgi:hypothetical protein